MINKKIILVAVTLILTLMLSGTVSAANSNDTYAIGKNVTNQALKDTSLGLNKSSKNLVITTAGTAKLNNKTTEKSLSGIIDRTSSLSKGQKITYGNGNLVQINNQFGALKYVFVSKSSTGILKAKKFVVTANGSSYTITSSKTVIISPNITQSQWNTAKQQLGNDLFSIASIAGAWSNDAPIDLLALTESNGKISYGTISGYAATKAFIKQYSNYNRSKEYVILTVSGGYDDDGFIYFAPWNYKYFAQNGSNPLESAYIQWDTKAKTGNLVLFKFNETLLSLYKTQTGTTVVSGTLSEIQFNNWLLGILKNNPGQLLTIEKTAVINQTDLDYLYGTNSTAGKGLSENGRNYIFNLTNAAASFTVTTSTVLSDDSKYEYYVTLGKQIAQQAEDLLKIRKAYGDIAVSTAPVYATAGGIYIHGFYDGFASVLGTDPNNLIGIGNPYNFDSYVNNRYFNSVFYKKGINSTGGQVLYAIQAKYDTLTDNLTWSNPVDVTKAHMKPEGIPEVSTGAGGAAGEFFMSGMGAMPWSVTGYIWSINLPYDIKRTWNKIAHCMSPPKILSVNLNILSQLPLGPDEYYILLGQGSLSSSGDTARTDAARTYGLDVYPGSGTFYTPGDSSSTIVVRWNDKTKTGTVSLITFDSAALQALQNSEDAYKDVESPIWFANVIAGKTKTTLADIAKAFNVTKEIVITENELKALAASGNPVKFIQEYVPTTPTQPTTPTNSSSGQQNSTSSSTSSNGTEQSNDAFGVSVSAADTTSTSVGENSGQTKEGQQSNSGQNGKATEISEANPSNSSGGSDNSFWIIIGAAILAVLVGLGFFKGTILGYIKK